MEFEREPFPSDVVRETAENGQIVVFKSAPVEKVQRPIVTSSQEPVSPKV